MVKALSISECSKVNECICMLALIKDLFLRYICTLFITALRMVKALGISGCRKVNKCFLYVDPHQRPFLRYKIVLYLLLHQVWSKLWVFLSVLR